MLILGKLGLGFLVVVVAVVLAWKASQYIGGLWLVHAMNKSEAKRFQLIQQIRVQVSNKRRISDEDMTEVVNEYLRRRYGKTPVNSWMDCDLEELSKILTQYGQIGTVV